jgi:glycosyltransferase involved in cell wall biosynthesis
MNIEEAPCKMVNNEYILDIPSIKNEDLPNVSIITISKDRRKFFDLLINNWNKIIYPREKLEWIIFDEGDDNFEDLIQPYLETNNIKYRLLSKHINVGVKRNLTIMKASHDIILCMDDDDYYFPDSVLSRVRTLIYSKKECVISKKLAIINLNNNQSYYIDSESIPEATLCFYKNFWEKYKFKSGPKGEGMHMINNRYDKVISIPPFFNIIVMNHKVNYTAGLRDLTFNNASQVGSFMDFIDKDTQNIIKKIL